MSIITFDYKTNALKILAVYGSDIPTIVELVSAILENCVFAFDVLLSRLCGFLFIYSCSGCSGTFNNVVN